MRVQRRRAAGRWRPGGNARPVMVHRKPGRLHGAAVRTPDRDPRRGPAGVVIAGADRHRAGRRRAAAGSGRLRPGRRSPPACASKSTTTGSVGARIRSAAQRRIPYLAAIGANEAPHGLVALRLRDGRQPPAIPRLGRGIARCGGRSCALTRPPTNRNRRCLTSYQPHVSTTWALRSSPDERSAQVVSVRGRPPEGQASRPPRRRPRCPRS